MKIKAVKNPQEGIDHLKKLLYATVDSKTVLFLSGGKTPQNLYKMLAKEKKLHPGAVALVDERFGSALHKNSNDRMIRKTGLLYYLEDNGIPYFPILKRHLEGVSSVSLTAKDYDERVKEILSSFSKSIAIMGIGEDGHTAGLPARGQKSEVRSQNYVIGINNFPGEFRKRITLTFKALSKMDLLIISAFGSAKRNALNLMFTGGSEEEIPARFYTEPEIADKTLLITDLKI